MTVDRISLAVFAAATWHNRQVDKGGHPYILHPLQVMLRLQSESPEIMAAAVLHDVVEDTDATPEAIEAMFGEEVARLVDLLTHKKDEDYFGYIARIKADADATAIKLADIEENMRHDRGCPPSEERQAKYAKAKAILMGEWK